MLIYTGAGGSFAVVCSAAKMPSSCWGTYRRVAVVEIDPGVTSISMISDRARGVRSVVETWEKLNVGKTERCAYKRAWRKAETMARDLAGAS